MPTRTPGSSRFRQPRKMRPQPHVGMKFLWGFLITLAVLVVAVAIQQVWQKGYLQGLFHRPQEVVDDRDRSDRIDAGLREALDALGVSPIFVLQSQEEMEERGYRWRFRRLTARVSGEISLLRCNLAITKAVEAAGGQVLSGQQDPGGQRIILEVGADSLRTHLLEVISDKNIALTKGRLALVIDDFGAINNEVAERFLELPISLTVAVIPGHATSQQIAQRAKEAGHEVFVHLPMQPKEGQVDEENPVLVDLSEGEIRRRVRWALNEIPQASGVNNHMGSLATENRQVMRAVLQEIKTAGLFFVDSRTSSQSVGSEVAEAVGVTCIKSEGFLDDQDDRIQIKNRLEALAEKALQGGTAIGIGHIKENTLLVLREMIPQLEKRGLRFAHVSRVLRERQQH